MRTYIIGTPEGDLQVFSIEDAATKLDCTVDDLCRWAGWNLISYVDDGEEVWPLAEEVFWLYKAGQKFPDWPYDRLLWRRYELARSRKAQSQPRTVVEADDPHMAAALAPTSRIEYRDIPQSKVPARASRKGRW